MTFENYKYTRPNLEETSKKLLDIEKRVLDAASAKDVLAVFDEYNTLRRDLETQSVLVEIDIQLILLIVSMKKNKTSGMIINQN